MNWNRKVISNSSIKRRIHICRLYVGKHVDKQPEEQIVTK